MIAPQANKSDGDEIGGITLIVGLGNVGDKYARNRHNAGFWFVDRLADERSAEFRSIKKMGASCDIEVSSRRVRLFKSDGYMNTSGQGLGEIMRYWKIAPENTLVAYDELDFSVGQLRLRFGGGAAGHNGVRSVIEHIGKSFWRLRIGIENERSATRGAEYVLSNAAATERQLIDAQFDRVNALLPHLASGDFERAMTALHTESEARDEAGSRRGA